MPMIPSTRQNRTIVLNFISEHNYCEFLKDRSHFRFFLNAAFAHSPELFPPLFHQGFHLHGFIYSIKQDLSIRRIRLKANRQAYQIRPSFVMPYMTSRTSEVSNILKVRQWGVPFWMLAHLGGHDHMFWYRMYASMGRYSVVGTTIKQPSLLPEHLLVDEKHTRRKGNKVYVATTVASNCFLGAEIAQSAGKKALVEAYDVFKQEACALDSEYTPKSVTTDGWEATQNTWLQLFDGIGVILCFLHGFLSIKKRCRRNKDVLHEVGNKVWNVYRAETIACFSQRIRRLKAWAVKNVKLETVKEQIVKLCNKRDQYKEAYRYPGAPRTSNGVDRLMDFQDRQLYAMRYLRGEKKSAQLAVRSMALLWNFHHYDRGKGSSPFEKLNGFYYHEDWLQNFNIAASLQRQYALHKIRDD